MSYDIVWFLLLGAAAGGFINGLSGTGTALFALGFYLGVHLVIFVVVAGVPVMAQKPQMMVPFAVQAQARVNIGLVNSHPKQMLLMWSMSMFILIIIPRRMPWSGVHRQKMAFGKSWPIVVLSASTAPLASQLQ